MATEASPLTLAFWPTLSRRTAQTIVTGITRSMSFVSPTTAATAMAPKATWLRPSPMKEKRRSTRVTPSREEHREISTPTIRAFWTKVSCR